MSGTLPEIKQNTVFDGESSPQPPLLAPMRILKHLSERKAFDATRAVDVDEIASAVFEPVSRVEACLKSLTAPGFVVAPVVCNDLCQSFRAYYIEQRHERIAELADRLKAHAMALDAQGHFLEIIADAMKANIPVWESRKIPVA